MNWFGASARKYAFLGVFAAAISAAPAAQAAVDWAEDFSNPVITSGSITYYANFSGNGTGGSVIDVIPFNVPASAFAGESNATLTLSFPNQFNVTSVEIGSASLGFQALTRLGTSPFFQTLAPLMIGANASSVPLLFRFAFSGTGTYGGTLTFTTTAPRNGQDVPGPVAGAGLTAMLGLFGVAMLRRRKGQAAA